METLTFSSERYRAGQVAEGPRYIEASKFYDYRSRSVRRSSEISLSQRLKGTRLMIDPSRAAGSSLLPPTKLLAITQEDLEESSANRL